MRGGNSNCFDLSHENSSRFTQRAKIVQNLAQKHCDSSLTTAQYTSTPPINPNTVRFQHTNEGPHGVKRLEFSWLSCSVLNTQTRSEVPPNKNQKPVLTKARSPLRVISATSEELGLQLFLAAVRTSSRALFACRTLISILVSIESCVCTPGEAVCL